MDLASNWDLFVEIGAASSILTRLIRQAIPDDIEARPLFRRFLHFAPIFIAAALLGMVAHLPEGGPMWIHAVAIGGMSSNLRDLAVDLAMKAKAEKGSAGSSAGKASAATGDAPPRSPKEEAGASLPSLR